MPQLGVTIGMEAPQFPKISSPFDFTSSSAVHFEGKTDQKLKHELLCRSRRRFLSFNGPLATPPNPFPPEFGQNPTTLLKK